MRIMNNSTTAGSGLKACQLRDIAQIGNVVAPEKGPRILVRGKQGLVIDRKPGIVCEFRRGNLSSQEHRVRLVGYIHDGEEAGVDV